MQRQRERVSRAVAGARATARGARPVVHGNGAARAPADVRLEELERLAGLREAGVLDSDEFQSEKRRILGTERAEAASPAEPVQSA
jgi:hypothetical protein